MKTEVRNLKTPVTVEKREDGSIKSIVGYPIVYNKDSEDMGFIERIAPGAATKALKKSEIFTKVSIDVTGVFSEAKTPKDKSGVTNP